MCPRTVTAGIIEAIADMQGWVKIWHRCDYFSAHTKTKLASGNVAKKYPCVRSLDGKLTPLLPAVVVVWSHAQKQRCKLTCCVLKSKPRNKVPASPAIVNLGVAIGTVLSE